MDDGPECRHRPRRRGGAQAVLRLTARVSSRACAPSTFPWGGALHIRVRLPPSYREQDEQRYPVLYCQDGQSVWSDGTDPFGTWGLDRVLDELWDVGALDEIIVVSIETGEGRLERLAPVREPPRGRSTAPIISAAWSRC